MPSPARCLLGGGLPRSEAPAIVATGAGPEPLELSFAELAEEVERVAGGLAADGLEPGEPVALIAPPSVPWIVACLGVARAGGVAVPVDGQLPRRALEHVLADCRARRVFTTRRRELLVSERMPAGFDEPRLWLLDAEEDERGSWRRLRGDPPRPTHDPDGGPGGTAGTEGARTDDGRTVVTFYTSGTTGPPKGVPLSRNNLDFQVRTIAAMELIGEDDRVLVPLPLHHVYPLVLGVLAPLSLGGAVVLPRRQSGPQVLRALSAGGATVVVGVPRLYRGLLAGIDARARDRGRTAAGLLRGLEALAGAVRRATGARAGKRLLAPLHERLGPRLRIVASGGSALDPGVARRLEALGWDLAIGYGLTETSPLLALRRPNEGPVDSVGRPVPDTEIRFADPEDGGTEGESEEADGDRDGGANGASRARGEILARGPGVFAGYRGLPDRTAEAFTDDGFYRTGDLGRLDAEGFLFVEGRADTRLTTVGGENVQPQEIEAVYQAEEEIEEAGVLEDDGRLVALLVPAEGRAEDGDAREAVRAAVTRASKELASYQRLSSFEITGEPLPRTRLGKIRRHRLAELWERVRQDGDGDGEQRRAEAGELSGEDLALLDDPAAAAAWDLLHERFPDAEPGPDTNLRFDLGLDSLDWLEWSAAVEERAGVELDEGVGGRVDTVRDLLEEVADAPRASSEASAPADRSGGGTGGEASRSASDPWALREEDRRRLSRRGPLARAVFAVASGLLRVLVRTLFRPRVQGRDRLPPAGSPVVLAPNHASHLDAFVLAAVVGHERLRRMRWGGWVGAAFTNPLISAASRAAGVLPVDPGNAARSSLALGSAVLERDLWLGWFPEGRRSETGELQPFRPGIGRLVARQRVPVVPVRIEGTHEALPPGRIVPRPRRLRVVLGEPVTPEELGADRADEQEIADAVRERVAALATGP